MFKQFRDLIRRFKNRYLVAHYKGKVSLWVDDERPAPWGWYHATSVQEAIAVLLTFDVSRLALDHDLGSSSTQTGYDLVKWIVANQEEDGVSFWPDERPFIITANPLGRANMMQLIDRYGPFVPYNGHLH